ncbi:hypothetical protein [Allorhodopirellula solitaria]|uniref:Uncharacterized protein n=1 Tax=Allorhodopirellula solitaria TaxID=2527987 RepID=A0A5C5X8N0_9BACT|nr:hypothetical protein [Allorhodopirellula solitaria]TWT59290.1 hypothetical protein CA85_39860 [Allorhodopirellula solitaria]
MNQDSKDDIQSEAASEMMVSDDLAAFEQRLCKLVPASALNHDRLLFAAGVAHESQRRMNDRIPALMRYAGIAIAASLLTTLTLSFYDLHANGDAPRAQLIMTQDDQPVQHAIASSGEQTNAMDSIASGPEPAALLEEHNYPLKPQRVSTRSSLSTLLNQYSGEEWIDDQKHYGPEDFKDRHTPTFPTMSLPTTLQWQRQLFRS